MVDASSDGTARLIAEVACSYGLDSVEDWRWINEGGSPAVAMLHADGRRYVARLFHGEVVLTRAVTELGLGIRD